MLSNENLVEEFTALEYAWADAMASSDMAALEQIVAPEYRFVSPAPGGIVITREQAFEQIRSGGLRITSTDLSDVSVQRVDQIAIVRGINHAQLSAGQMKIDAAFRFTNVYIEREGRWQVLAAHNSPLDFVPAPPAG